MNLIDTDMKHLIIQIKRHIRLLSVKIGWIKEGDRLWYYYLPTDKIIDSVRNINKPHDVIMRGDKFGVKHKSEDILREGFYDKETAQIIVDKEYLLFSKYERNKNYYHGDQW